MFVHNQNYDIHGRQFVDDLMQIFLPQAIDLANTYHGYHNFDYEQTFLKILPIKVYLRNMTFDDLEYKKEQFSFTFDEGKKRQ